MAASIKDVMDTYFASKDEMAELNKAITTAAGSAYDLQPIEYDPDILKMLVLKAPFLARLKAIGVEKPWTSSAVAYRRKLTGSASSFIGETANIPTSTDSTWEAKEARMKVLVNPIEISDLAQKGGQNVLDIYADEIGDAMLDMDQTKNKQIIYGAKGSPEVAWDGLQTLVTTNTTNNEGQPLTKNILRSACDDMIKLGGTPTAILTTAEVAHDLEDELYPGIRNVPVAEMTPGFNVTAFRSPAGMDIPIITDLNVPNAPAQRECYVLDETVLNIRTLMAPTPIPLAKTKLTTSEVLASFTTFFCKAEQWNARIYNIAGPDD